MKYNYVENPIKILSEEAFKAYSNWNPLKIACNGEQYKLVGCVETEWMSLSELDEYLIAFNEDDEEEI